ncbi:Putative xanthine dehydrogenase YagT iron-sulfur-binding subunit [bacterium HR33]|nr:Putative xanthine dehydrogenase YagT iron-sulfur-binding subunit [bacterium HR33]
MKLSLKINGTAREFSVGAETTLLDLLREHCALTGAKRACDRGECGACTVLLDQKPVYACILPALYCEGRSVITIEGIAPPGKLHPVQRAFIESDALQCGYCTPGQILSAVALLQRHRRPSLEQISEAMSGNLCRCGAYPKILRAIRRLGSRQRRRRGA